VVSQVTRKVPATEALLGAKGHDNSGNNTRLARWNRFEVTATTQQRLDAVVREKRPAPLRNLFALTSAEQPAGSSRGRAIGRQTPIPDAQSGIS